MSFNLLINARNKNSLKNFMEQDQDYPSDSNFDFKISNINQSFIDFHMTKQLI